MGTTATEAFDLTLIAFGAGTGGIYVKAEVAKKFRATYSSDFENEIDNWEPQKLFVLECARAIGRLAAQNAISRGSMAINWDDAKKAAQYVVQRYGGPVPGGWCSGSGSGGNGDT